MSREAFESVIGKAVVEAEFRYLLLADPDQALAGFDLTEEEKKTLKKIDGETLDSLGRTLYAFTRKISAATGKENLDYEEFKEEKIIRPMSKKGD